NGYEFALTLLVATAALAIQGAGSLSVDNVIAKKLANKSLPQ
ncbi:MAG TPA: DoxD-like family protein, partial [Pseudoalteromonas sp.]|nr:DoxD-like family protein [Pseudoalteromonas sp.]